MRVATDTGPAVQLERLSVRAGFETGFALRDVNLTVRTGEIVALLGPNGAGKSTLLRALAGLLVPGAGSGRVLGNTLPPEDRRAYARQVAFVPQSEDVATGFCVRDVVAMGRAPHQDPWMRERPEDAVAVAEALRRSDLSRLANRRVETLSGGELRRVAIARALAQGPRVLLLDEPAAFLDVRHRLELDAMLLEAAKEAPLACVVAMHELSTAARLASSVLLLRAGRVVACGAPEVTMTRAHLRQAFDAELQPGRDPSTGEPYFVVERPRS